MHRLEYTKALTAIAALTLCLQACGDDKSDGGGGSGGEPDPSLGDLAIGQQVDYPTDGWTVVDPSEMGMAQADIDKALDYAFEADMNTQGVVIIRGGAIVAERYADGRDMNSPAASWSAAKSFASAMVGIARDEGAIDSTEQPMSDFIDAWKGDPRGEMSLRSVLMMQSGLNFVEDYSDGNSEMVQLASAMDANQYAATLTKGFEPDERWYYSSGDTQLLSAVIESAVGMTAGEYAKEKLFSRIGMNTAAWWKDQAGHTLTYCCVDTTTREFAKFGLLFLRNGYWDGEQIVSEKWVKESTQTLATNYDGYAYQWWTAAANTAVDFPSDMYSAQGLDTQRIIVIPSLDLVIAKNTIYEKPDIPEQATGGVVGVGWLLDIQPRGGEGTGKVLEQMGAGFLGGVIQPAGYTLAPLLWEDSVFVSHIVNAVDGAEKLPTDRSVVDRNIDDPPAACRENAQDGYGAYCEEMHGCMCDSCAEEFLDCDGLPECAAIMACAIDAQCRGIECLTPCEQVIQENGGVDGAGVQLALALSECADGPCPVACP